MVLEVYHVLFSVIKSYWAKTSFEQSFGRNPTASQFALRLYVPLAREEFLLRARSSYKSHESTTHRKTRWDLFG